MVLPMSPPQVNPLAGTITSAALLYRDETMTIDNMINIFFILSSLLIQVKFIHQIEITFD